MGKLPAFQFYPADWRKDPGIGALSYEQRGIWFEMLCIMHESESRGYLQINGKKIEINVLSRILGLNKQKLSKAIATFIEFKVCSIDDNGVIYSRRMVKDEHIRQVRAEAGKKGGNPRLLDLHKQTPKQNPTPSYPYSSPSSITSSESTNPLPLNKGEEFCLSSENANPPLEKQPKKKRISQAQKKRIKVKKNTELMVKLGELFDRRSTTLWNLYEAEALQELNPDKDEIAIIVKYYQADDIGEIDPRRQNAETLLNNWTGEIDRAKKWKKRSKPENPVDYIMSIKEEDALRKVMNESSDDYTEAEYIRLSEDKRRLDGTLRSAWGAELAEQELNTN